MKLTGKRICFLVEEGFEDLEFWAVHMRLEEEGAHITIAAPKAGATFRSKSGGLTATAAAAVADLHAAHFDAVVVPGGWAPDKLRRYEAVKSLVADAYVQGKIVGMICHAGWVGASARIVRSHRCTGSIAIRDDMENAGAEWVDLPAFRDRNLVWGRVVADIPAFNRELVRAIAENSSPTVSA
jgi:protease I